MKAIQHKKQNMNKKGSTNEQAKIRSVLDEWADAVRTKDADKILSHFVADLVLFDLAPPLKYAGVDAYKKSLNEWFSTFAGPIGYEFGELEITAGSEVAFVHGINHMTGKRTNGEQTDVWVRATVALRKIDGKWMVSHEHISVPFYMDGSDKAALDLKP